MPAFVVTGAEKPNSATVLWQAVMPTVTASSSAVGYPAINVTDPATWSSWRGAGVNSWIGYDFGTPVSVDALGLAAHDLATSGVTSISIATSPTAAIGSFITVATYTTLTNEDILAIFPAVTNRYWRVYINGPAANIGVIVFGKRLVFPHAPVDGYTPLHHSRQYTKMFNDSIKGQFLGNRVMAAGAETDVDMGMFDRPWLEGNIRPFEYHYNQGGCFFYAGCPGKYPLDMGYCRALGDDESLAIEWTEADKLATLSFGIRSYVG